MQSANVLVGLEDVSDLLPGIIHVLLGIGFNDLSSVIRRDAETRVEIEPMHPVRGIGRGRPVAVEENSLGQRVPAPVKRGGNKRIGIVRDVGNDGLSDACAAWRDPAGGIGVGWCLGRIVVGQIDELRQRHLKRVGVRLVPVLVRVALGLVSIAEVGIGNFQRSAQAQDAFQAGFVDAGKIGARVLDIEGARAHRGIDRLRLEQADQIAEVAAVSGGELPSIVVGENLRLLLVCIKGPRRGRRRRSFVWIMTQPGKPPALEGRDDKSIVPGVDVQQARTKQSRISEVGIRDQDRLHARKHGAHIRRDQLLGRTR